MYDAMNRRDLLISIAAFAGGAGTAAADAARAQPAAPANLPAGEPVGRWLEIAERLKPVLTETLQEPLRLVRPQADASLVLRYRMETEAPATELAAHTFRRGDSFILDFGGHRTGHLSFRLETVGREPDSPVRLRLVFGEVPTDVAEPLYPYKGQLSEAWLPDETVNIDFLPRTVELPRRYAFRYVKVEVIDTSPGFGVQFHDVRAHALTAANTMPEPLPARISDTWRRIDEVSIATLRDCLQTTFEDGPRRDQRLWIGDLRLQALTNYATFKRNDVVKRCLYLFAALPRADGLVSACVFEKPKPVYGGIPIFDYALLYCVAVKDYVDATGDLETGRDLWPVVKRQLDILGRTVGADGLFVDPKTMWLFIDWATELDRTAAIQGVMIYAYRKAYALAAQLGVQGEVADYPKIVERMVGAARRAYWDPARKLFVGGPKRQVSWASQAWLVIAGVPASNAQASQAIRNAIASPDAVKPVTPYLYYYMADAMLTCGMAAEARDLVDLYWGGMLRAGADTFWEIYAPGQPLSSPYGDIHINSYCHAWSCTPAYLLRSCGLV